MPECSLHLLHLTDVHLIGIYLTGAYLTGVYLTGVHLISHRRTSRERASLVGLSGGPLWWASLAGLSRGHASVSPPKAVSSVSASEPVSSTPAPEPVSCLRPRACVPYPHPRSLFPAPVHVPIPEPRRSKRTLYPGPLCCFSRAQPAEASLGWKRIDSYSLASRTIWIQLWVSCYG
jgi:hypothetical protein